MFEVFETYITAKVALTKDELNHIHSLSVKRKLRRKELLLQEGEICRYKIFVCKGLLKNYRTRDDGSEHIMHFAPENNWTTDHKSYSTQTPSKYNIEALEDTEVLLWTQENFNELYNAIPAFKSYVGKLISRSLDASHERILANISYTSEEKYQDFITSFPDVFRRVPLHMVASYLGVSRETLSRIRHSQLNGI